MKDIWPYALGWFLGILIAQGIWVLLIFVIDKIRDLISPKIDCGPRIITQITNGIDIDCDNKSKIEIIK